jgi:mannose-6-phosphate isomerase-like protein (cupin superfamily)
MISNSESSVVRSSMLTRHDRETVEQIHIDGELCAILLSAAYDDPGIKFFTPNEFSQQMASMSYAAGKVIPAHIHNTVRREVFYTQEALFIRKGSVRVDFYSQQKQYRTSRILKAGDVILLISGGHGFEVLEDLNMVEVKQGPYAGDMDKTRFTAVMPTELKFD